LRPQQKLVISKTWISLVETIIGHFKNMDLSSQILDMGPDPGFGSSNPGFGCPIFEIIQKAWIWTSRSWIWTPNPGFRRPNPGLGCPNPDLDVQIQDLDVQSQDSKSNPCFHFGVGTQPPTLIIESGNGIQSHPYHSPTFLKEVLILRADSEIRDG
jgi:hypothetical protein